MPARDVVDDRFSDDTIARLFQPLADVAELGGGIAVAVSGGADSTALLLLFSRYCHSNRAALGPVVVVTVDHRLRPDSAKEAADVATLCGTLDLAHVTLLWEGAKPASGLAAAARNARYDLIARFMRARGLHVLLTAHTRDDQAETVLMRLARGSGVDGLAAMTAVSTLPSASPDAAPLRLVRPLLDVPKADLETYLRQSGLGWAEDPTNLDPAYERPRLRAHAPVLAEIGLTPDALARAARRMARARTALETVTSAVLTSAAVTVYRLGYISVDRAAFDALDEEIALRALRRIVAVAGGSTEPVALSAVEEHVAHLRASGAGFTLAGALVAVRADVIVFEREPGRLGLPIEPLAANAFVLWDNRFWVRSGAVADGFVIGPLAAEGIKILESEGWVRPCGVSANALRTLPAVWRGHDLVAVPDLGFFAKPLQLPVATAFKGLSSAPPALS